MPVNIYILPVVYKILLLLDSNGRLTGGHFNNRELNAD
jgi:hypothetical protein